MSDIKTYSIKDNIGLTTLLNNEQYEFLYKRSIEDSEGFWADQGKRIDWIQPYTQVRDVSFDEHQLMIDILLIKNCMAKCVSSLMR